MTQKFQVKRKGTITQQTEFELEIPSFLSTDQEKLNFASAYLRENHEGMDWVTLPSNSAWSELNVEFVKSETRQAIEAGCTHLLVEPAGYTYKCSECGRVFETSGELISAQQKAQNYVKA